MWIMETGSVSKNWISVYLYEAQKKDLFHFLTKYIDVFVWTYEDMLGLSTSVVSHKLPINQGFMQ